MFQHYLQRFRERLVEHIDGPLLVITLVLMAFGLATIFSATYDANNRAVSQLLNMGVGLVGMWAVAQLPPQKLMRFAVPLYVVGVIMLIWIGVETLLLGYISFLQPVIMVWGLLILFLPLVPANRRYYSIKP